MKPGIKGMVQSLENPPKYSVAVLCGIVISCIFMYVWIFGVNVLFLDEWTFIPLVRDYQAHGISFNMLFTQHNEHRLFFPRLLYLGLLPLGHMNSKMFMY